MMFKFLIFLSILLIVSTDDQFGVSSALLHTLNPPKLGAFMDLGEYSTIIIF